MSYEHLRNEFLRVADGLGMLPLELEKAVQALDQVASKYEVKPRELSLVVYNDDLPELVKTYIICKKIGGLSDKTLETYMRMMRIFFRHFKKPVEHIGANDIRVFLYRYQQERGCSNRSLDKYRGYLSSFFSWAAMQGYLPCDPMQSITPIKYEKKLRESLTQLELEYLRQACRTIREKALIEFFCSTACRVSELSTVRRSDVNWNERSVHLFGKGQKHRMSYINPKSEVALLKYLRTRSDDCEYLFVSERKPHRQLTTAAIEKIIRNIAARTDGKISKKITPHVLRHTTATLALENGMPIEMIRELLGHENLNTTLIYAHTSQASVQAGHRKHVI